MIKLFFIYFLLTGIYGWYKIQKSDINDLNLDDLSDDRKAYLYLFVAITNRDLNKLKPMLQILVLLFGWILVPISLFYKIMDKFKLK